jgi:hypothetical protein
MDVFGPPIAKLLLHCATDEVQPGLVEPGAQLVDATYPDHDWRSICGEPETPFALLERRLITSPLSKQRG